MIEDLLIINDSGLLLFGWHPEGASGEDQDNLISGFFTALNSFATFEKGEDLKSIKLRETTIIFEKYEKLFQKLVFIITTKNESMIDLLHAIVHIIMDSFVDIYNKEINREFDGSVSTFRDFTEVFNQILKDFGMDLIQNDIYRIDDKDILKAFILLNPLDGSILFIHAKQYVNKEDISFLVPLMRNTGKMVLHNFDENMSRITLTSIKNEHIELIIRERVVIVRFYVIDKKSNDHLVVVEFMKNNEKLLKKPKKVEKLLSSVNWGSNIRSIIFMDLFGDILFSKIMEDSHSFLDNTTEIISFMSSCKKTSQKIFNKEMFTSSIESQQLSAICVNLDTLILFATIDNMDSSYNFLELRDVSRELLKKI